jgi:hypothetical protein
MADKNAISAIKIDLPVPRATEEFRINLRPNRMKPFTSAKYEPTVNYDEPIVMGVRGARQGIFANIQSPF